VHAEPVEDGQGERQHRLADVEPGELLAFDDEDPASRARQRRGDRRAARASAHDDRVVR
jgi:hypothetical protein